MSDRSDGTDNALYQQGTSTTERNGSKSTFFVLGKSLVLVPTVTLIHGDLIFFDKSGTLGYWGRLARRGDS
jgi:hypothetical protein